MDFNFLVAEFENKSNLKKNDILNLVDKKHSEMSELITKEGALYLVAKEMGIDLPEQTSSGPSIKSIAVGLRNVSVIGRIFRISKINEFTKSNGSAGRVANIFIGDNTGSIRIPLWDDQVKLLEEDVLSIGDVVQVNNGFSRENIFGEVEISVGRFGSIHTVDGYVELPSVEQLSKTGFNVSPERTVISDIVSGGNFEIKGTIVQIFKGNFIFDVCSMCNNKTENNKCPDHGEVTPNHQLVVSFVIDDGTGDLRCVLFRESAERFTEITAQELFNHDPETRYKMISDKISGKEFVLSGRVKKNNLFDRLEMMVNDSKGINPLEESKRLLSEVESLVGV